MIARTTESGKLEPTPPTPRLAKVAWMLFDNATIGFFVLVLIFIYGPYFVSYVAPNPVKGQEIWGFTIGIAGLAVAILSPVLGAIADVTGRRKLWILGFSVLIIAGLVPLYFLLPGDVAGIPISMIFLGISFFGIRLATTFNNAMIPQIAPIEEVGKLSGYGAAVGNTGGVVLIVFVLGFLVSDPETGKTLLGLMPAFSLEGTSFQGERATVLLSALWYAIFIIPLMIFVPDSIKYTKSTAPVRTGLRKLGQTLADLPKRKSYAVFLIAVMFYRNGIGTLYVFGGIYAAGVLQLPITIVGVFGVLAIMFGAIGGVVGGQLDQRFGPKIVIQVACVILAMNGLLFISITNDAIFFFVPVDSNELVLGLYLAAGAIAGGASSAAQAASRSLLVRLVQPSEVTEAFGLYDLASRIIAFSGPLTVAFVTQWSNSQRVGIAPIVLLLIVGAIALFWVNDDGTGKKV